jgi:8-oxo-dGTP pyrophosphatase MutT (NUDIX family)
MDKNRGVVCNNCGVKGHIYRDCRFPVLSYGNILFRRDGGEPMILMVQRKDSLCYTELVRGKYDPHNETYIQLLVDKCSCKEKQKLKKHDYETLWSDLWMISETSHNNLKYRKNYTTGKEKFETIRKCITVSHSKPINLETIIDRSTTNYPGPEWEFPKGRRNPGETNRECAIREFEEETGYKTSDYLYITNIAPFYEEYVGENRVRYKHIYYVGYLKNMEKEIYVDQENPNQAPEIQDIRWMTRKDALEIIRYYHHTRRMVIERLFEFVSEIDINYFVVE